MTNNEVPGRRIKSTDTVFGIIDALKTLNGATVSELASRLDLAPSTVHDHLATLSYWGYVTQRDSQYHLGLNFLGLGMSAREKYDILRPGHRAITRLADKTSNMTQLLVEENGRAIVLCRSNPDEESIENDSLGKVLPMHCSAGGKALLASYPRKRVLEILDQHGLPRFTENTITSREDLFEELSTIREQSYAINDGESIHGVRSVGCPVMIDDSTLGAVTVTGSRHTVDGDRLNKVIPQCALRSANEIELALTNLDDSNVL